MCHFIQSSYNLLYRERACISQDRTGLAAVADKPQIALTSNNQGLFLPLLCAYCWSTEGSVLQGLCPHLRSRAEGAAPHSH